MPENPICECPLLPVTVPPIIERRLSLDDNISDFFYPSDLIKSEPETETESEPESVPEPEPEPESHSDSESESEPIQPSEPESDTSCEEVIYFPGNMTSNNLGENCIH